MTNKEQFLKDISTSLLARMILAVKPKCEPCFKGYPRNVFRDCKTCVKEWLEQEAKMTNLERIQGMTLKQFAVFILRKKYPCVCCIYDKEACDEAKSPCLKGIEEWLGSMSEGDVTSNYDVIKIVPADEIAKLIYMTGSGCGYCVYQDEPCSKGNLDCKHGIEKWLLRKVKE